jgi:hypothetical protein
MVDWACVLQRSAVKDQISISQGEVTWQKKFFELT